MAPSGVQKEMIEPSDVFECDLSGEIICNPSSKLKLTECAPLFMNAYNLRKAGKFSFFQSCFPRFLLFKLVVLIGDS